MKNQKISVQSELKENILRIQIELMKNSGYTDEEIGAHKKEAMANKNKKQEAKEVK